jgi:DNA-binding NarL/FixJ family response regulator
MKILIISDRDVLREEIVKHFQPLGFDIIHYWNPIKAMDNLDETDPDIVLFSAQDFPRHWKPFLTFLRNTKSRLETVFILLKGDDFEAEEVSKGVHLGVNGIIHEDLSDKSELARLQELVDRYKELKESRKIFRLIPEDFDRIEFAFTQPETLRIITGLVLDLSSNGLSFRPARTDTLGELEIGTVLDTCSLRFGTTIASLSCRIIRITDSIGLSFYSAAENLLLDLADYIEEHTSRKLHKLTEQL